MAQNLEIKATFSGDFEQARNIASQLNAIHHGLDHQIDTYFKTINEGRFKLRESSLSGAYLVPYMRPTQAGTKKSLYEVIQVAPEKVFATKEIFIQLYGLDTIVEKIRDIYLYKNVRIHLDQVKGLGTFFELEAVFQSDTQEQRDHEQMQIDFLMNEFGIKPNHLLQGSYREMRIKI